MKNNLWYNRKKQERGIMLLNIDRHKAKDLLNDAIQKGKEFLGVNPLSLPNIKIEANDWYQEVIGLLNDVFDDPKDIIDDMNKTLNKEEKPMISSSLRRTFNIASLDLEGDTAVFITKLNKVLDILKQVMEYYTKP